MEAKAQVFLGYAREDAEKAKDLYQKLSDAGFKPWMDKKDILPGEKWELAIQKAIRRSDFFLACLSAHSVSKRGVLQKEVRQALDMWQEKLEEDIYLIPVRLEDCEVPESLRKFQWVNLFEEDGWTRLVEAIQVGMERRAEATADEEPSPDSEMATPEEGPERVRDQMFLKEVDLKPVLSLLPEHWLTKAVGGIVAYVGFLGVLKGALPGLSRNELLGLYPAITGLLIVICLIAIPVTRRARIPLPTKGELTRILITWIVSGFVGILLFLKLMSPSPLPYIWDRLCSIVLSPSIAIKVHRDDRTSRLVSGGQSVVVRPGERVTLTVGLDPLPNLCRDYSFLPTSRFGDVRTLSSYELEYIAPKHEPVDYIVICATDQLTGQRLEQPFNVVIQDQE